MGYVVICACGQTLRSEHEDGIVTEVESHVRDDHPEMAGDMSREKALAMAHQE